jgi:phthiodiolone/phenolphthiodiolone dimycocerosates ketoreductase
MIETMVVRFFGVLAPAELWRRVGRTHPFGDQFGGIVDFVPGDYTREELEAAIAAVPVEMANQGLLYGTPEQVVAQLRAYGDVGLRHAILQVASAAISRKAALYSTRALRAIAKEMHRGGGGWGVGVRGWGVGGGTD